MWFHTSIQFVYKLRMEDVARFLNLPANDIREINLFQRGDKTHYGQHLEECSLQRCWDECKSLNGYDNEKNEIERWYFYTICHSDVGISFANCISYHWCKMLTFQLQFEQSVEKEGNVNDTCNVWNIVSLILYTYIAKRILRAIISKGILYISTVWLKTKLQIYCFSHESRRSPYSGISRRICSSLPRWHRNGAGLVYKNNSGK